MNEKSKISKKTSDNNKQQSKKQINQSENDVSDDSEQRPVSSNDGDDCNNFESFKKNAVHVNDLENHWHQEVVAAASSTRRQISHTAAHDTNQNPNRHLPKNETTITTTNTIIMDEKTFSSYKSNKNKQPKPMCFISCLNKYNVCLQDTAELSINNYANLVNFIYARKFKFLLYFTFGLKIILFFFFRLD